MATLDEVISNPQDQIEHRGKVYQVSALRMDDYGVIMRSLKKHLRDEFQSVKMQLDELNKTDILDTMDRIEILKLEVESLNRKNPKADPNAALTEKDIQVRESEMGRLDNWVTQLAKERQYLFDKAYNDFITPSILWMAPAYTEFIYTPDGASLTFYLMSQRAKSKLTREDTDTLMVEDGFFSKFMEVFDRISSSEQASRDEIKN